MPSPIDKTVPTSATSASVPKFAICCLIISEISAGRISMKTPSSDTLHRQLQALQLAFDRRIHHARPDFDNHTANEPWVDTQIDRDAAADAVAQLLVQRRQLHLAQRPRRDYLRVDFAAAPRELLQKRFDDCGDHKQPSVSRNDPEKIAHHLRQSRVLSERPDSLGLIVARKDRATDQP